MKLTEFIQYMFIHQLIRCKCKARQRQCTQMVGQCKQSISGVQGRDQLKWPTEVFCKYVVQNCINILCEKITT